MGILTLTTNLVDYSKFKPRGRIENAYLRRVEDVKRIGKWFTTTEGILFTAKQKVLAFSVDSQLEDMGKYNNNLYSPTNTLLSVGTSGTGLRFTKQGIFPVKSIIRYEDLKDEDGNIGNDQLIKEYDKRVKDPVYIKKSWRNLLFIRPESDPKRLVFEREREKQQGIKFTHEDKIWLRLGGRSDLPEEKRYHLFGYSIYPDLEGRQLRFSNYNLKEYVEVGSRSYDEVYKAHQKISQEGIDNSIKYNQNLPGDLGRIGNIIHRDKNISTKIRSDLEKNTPIYSSFSEEEKRRISVFLDQINLTGISEEQTLDDEDLITFKISHIGKSGSPTSTVYFRAYLNPITDQYIADWQTEKFAGRGEEFFTYAGFSRNLGFDFNILVQSRLELKTVYEKLNYLSSLMTPKYNNNIMSGNIVELTIGNYIKKLPGVITNLSYNIGEDTTWGIEKGSQLPMLVRVNGFNFKPIHTFVPEFRERNPHEYMGMEMDIK